MSTSSDQDITLAYPIASCGSEKPHYRYWDEYNGQNGINDFLEIHGVGCTSGEGKWESGKVPNVLVSQLPSILIYYVVTHHAKFRGNTNIQMPQPLTSKLWLDSPSTFIVTEALRHPNTSESEYAENTRAGVIYALEPSSACHCRVC